MVQLFGFGRQSASTPAQGIAAPNSFAEDDAGFSYFSSDQHHHYLAAEICRYLIEGRSFVLVTGRADGDLIVRAINNGNQPTYRASIVQCLPDMDLGMLVRAYSAELGLNPSAASGASRRIVVQNGSAQLKSEPESGSIWTLISYLMTERQSGITRILVLKDVDLLDLRCFDDLQRLALLDEQHVMPVVLLSNASDRSALTPFDVLQSPIVGRLTVDHLEPAEVGAFIQSQLAALDKAEEMNVLFPPRIVETIAIASGGDAAVINRLARKVVVAFSSRSRTSTSGESSSSHIARTEPTGGEQAAPDASHVSSEQNSKAIAETKPVSATAETLVMDKRRVSSRATDKDDERGIDIWPTAELVPADANDIASKTSDRRADAETESAPTGLQDLDKWSHEPCAAREPADDIGSANNDQHCIACEDHLIEFAHEAEDRSQPALIGERQSINPAVEAAANFAGAPSPDIGSMTISTAAEPVVAVIPPLNDVELNPSELSLEQSTATDAAVAGDVAERTKPHFRIDLMLAVTAIAILVAAAAMLYLSGLGRWQELLKSPRESGPQSTLKPEARAALPPLNGLDATKTVAEEPRPIVSAPTVSPARSLSVQGGTPVQSNLTTNKPARQSGDATTSEQPKTVPAQPSGSILYAPVVPSLQLPPASVVDQSTTREANVPLISPLTDTDAIMVQRGEQLLAAGDIVSARQFFERVAPTGNVAAAYRLAETYDPVFLKEIGVRGVLGQPAVAIAWYQRAVTGGSTKAVERLHRLQSAISSQSVPDKGVGK